MEIGYWKKKYIVLDMLALGWIIKFKEKEYFIIRIIRGCKYLILMIDLKVNFKMIGNKAKEKFFSQME